MDKWSGKDRRQPAEPTDRLILEVPQGGNLDKVLRLFIDALKAGGNDSSAVVAAINNLTNLVKEKFMGLKEDNEALNERFGRVETAVDLIAADVSALKAELEEANERANIDLSPLITRAEGIEARLTGIAGPNAGSDPATPPPVESPVEGGEVV